MVVHLDRCVGFVGHNSALRYCVQEEDRYINRVDQGGKQVS